MVQFKHLFWFGQQRNSSRFNTINYYLVLGYNIIYITHLIFRRHNFHPTLIKQLVLISFQIAMLCKSEDLNIAEVRGEDLFPVQGLETCLCKLSGWVAYLEYLIFKTTMSGPHNESQLKLLKAVVAVRWVVTNEHTQCNAAATQYSVRTFTS